MSARDDANTMVLLEVIIAGAIVLAYVVPMLLQADPPPLHPTDAKYRELQRKGDAIMVVMDTLPPANYSTHVLEREWGASYLERLIALRHARPVDAKYQWEGDLDWVYTDPGTFKQLAIGTFPAYRTLFGEKYGDPRGERVTTTRHLDPRWNRVHAESITDPVDGITSATFQAAWVNASRLARQPGEAIRFNASLDSLLANGRALDAYGLVGQSGTATPPTIALQWTKLNRYSVSPGEATVIVTSADTASPQDFSLALRCSPDATKLRAGVLLTIHAERGLGDLTIVEGDGWIAHGSRRALSDGSEEITLKRESPMFG